MRLRQLKKYCKMILFDKSTYKINYLKKLAMNLSGFTADQYIRFNFESNDKKEYISEIERWETRKINGRYNIVFDDKLLFYEIFKQYLNVPVNYGWISNGKIYDLDGNVFTDDKFLSFMQSKKKLIIKPVITGGSGKGVSLLSYTDAGYALNFKLLNPLKVIDFVKSCDDYLISEYVEQHEYSTKIFDKSVNTIRIVTIIEDCNAKVVDAIHRFGVIKTIPVDNAAKGGLVTQIDLKDGTLGESKTFFDSTPITHHPDTNSIIKGVRVPFWSETMKTLVKTHNHFPYIKFIAWDVVIMKDGFCVIEGNASTGLNIFQLWKGARNSELGKFYKRQGVIR